MGDHGLELYRAYRPLEFDDIVGNEEIIQSLRSVLARKEGIPSTFLFSGPSGCGKTTLARILAKRLGASGVRNLRELNISNTRGIDAARKIIENVRIRPLGGGSKVVILNECHRATVDFQNAMLEVLEEPPDKVYFILCTTDPQKLLPAVRTRCMKYEVKKLIKRQMKQLLEEVIEAEEADLSDEVIKGIIEVSGGSPREALVVLDSVIDIKDSKKALKAINSFAFEEKKILELSQALLKGFKWKEVSKILKGIKEEPEEIRMAVLGYMGAVLLSGKVSKRASDVITLFEDSFYNSGRAGLINACFILSM